MTNTPAAAPGQRVSLHRRLVRTITLFVTAIMLLVTVLVALVMKVELGRELMASLESSAGFDLQRIEQRLEHLVEGAARFSENPLVVNSLIDPQGRQAYLPKLVKVLAEAPDVKRVAVTDFEGRTIYASDPLGRDLYGDPYLRFTLATGTPSLTLSEWGSLYVIHPVEYYGTPQGAVVVEAALAELVARALPEQAGLFHRFHADDRDYYSHGYDPDARVYAVDRRADEHAPYLAKLNAGIETGKRFGDFIQPILAAIGELVAVSLLIIALAVWIAFRLGRGIAAPILTLCDRVRASSADEPSACAPVGTGDELEELAEVFDRRTGELVTAQRRIAEDKRRLEIEVAERQRAEAELAEAKERAEAANRAKSDFLATMSHEIRTPMNVVIGMGDVLLDSELTLEQRGYVELLQHSGNALLDLINNILDLSKIEVGKMEIAESPFELRRLVEETGAVMAVRAREKGLEFVVLIDPEVPRRVIGDGARLRQVLVNLIGNAVKFTSRGEIGLSLSVEGDRLAFSVADTGVGIAPGHLENIFEKFTQADASVARRYGGTGLGLSISKRLVELMGGVIRVESEVGLGSTFHFTLPLVAAEEAASAAKAPPAGGRAEVASASILLVEDSEDNRLLIRTYLKHTGHRLDFAADGEEGVVMVADGDYDLVLMDLQMPVVDGYTATRRIREWEAREGRPRVPILALSAHALEGDEERSLEAGCDAHLTKPIKKARLLQAIAQYARR